MRRSQHDPTDACQLDHCWIHNQDEPLPPPWRRLPGHIICGECFHYYPSFLHLRIANFRSFTYWAGVDGPRLRWALWKLRSLVRRHIWSCPHCAHDF